MKYNLLQLKTNYSLLDSLITIDDLISFSVKNNITVLPITDKNNMFNVLDFYIKCNKSNIKPVIGLDLDIIDNKHNILLYAKNYKGYMNLCKLSTIKSEKNINLEELKIYSDNLICIIPFNSLNVFNMVKNIFKSVYFGVSNMNEYNKLSKYSNLVYVNDIRSIYEDDLYYLEYLKLIKSNKNINDLSINFKDNYIHLDFPFKDNTLIINSTNIINECNVEIDFNQLHFVEFDNVKDKHQYLLNICIKGLNKRLNNNVSKKYMDRLNYELEIIDKMKFIDYFLIVFDYVKFAKNNNIFVGVGRGSACGCLVAYCLGITDVDPIIYELYFERFLNIERISMPDIDIDFQDNRRQEVIDYCVSKYGNKKVSKIITFSKMAPKQVLRDVGKILSIDIRIIDRLCKIISLNNKDNLTELYGIEEFKSIINENNQTKMLYEIAKKFEKFPKQKSEHAAAIVISNETLDNYMPLVKGDEMYIAGFEMGYVEKLGFLKMDFLGVKNLTEIKNIIDKLNIDFNTIPLNDKRTFNLFQKGATNGIFQFESDGMKKFLIKLKPEVIEDIFSAIALFRPGPIKNIDTFIRRKSKIERIDYIHSSLEDILKNTYGIIVYQEQIMKILSIVANYSLSESDIIRRAISKKLKEVLENEQNKFLERAINNNYDKDTALKIYNTILKFCNFGFNKSHSVAYGIISYKMAYLKANYTAHFLCEMLNSNINSSKYVTFLYEAKSYNIKILYPDINGSVYYNEVNNNSIQHGLCNIKGLNKSIIDIIINERNISGEYKSFIDFVKRTYKKGINESLLNILININAFESFEINKKTLLSNIPNIINYVNLIMDFGDDSLEEPLLDIIKDEENKCNDLDYFGYYIKDSTLDILRKQKNNQYRIKNLYNLIGKHIEIILTVKEIKSIKTKKNEDMCFIKLSDDFDNIDCVVFSDVYKNLDFTGLTDVLISGKVENKEDKLQIITKHIEKIDKVL